MPLKQIRAFSVQDSETSRKGVLKINQRINNATEEDRERAEIEAAVLNGEQPIPETYTKEQLIKVQKTLLDKFYDCANVLKNAGVNVYAATMIDNQIDAIRYAIHAYSIYNSTEFSQKVAAANKKSEKELIDACLRKIANVWERDVKLLLPDSPPKMPQGKFPYSKWGSTQYPFKFLNWPTDIKFHSPTNFGKHQCERFLKADLKIVRLQSSVNVVASIVTEVNRETPESSGSLSNGGSLSAELASAALAVDRESREILNESIGPINSDAATRTLEESGDIISNVLATSQTSDDEVTFMNSVDINKNEAVLVEVEEEEGQTGPVYVPALVEGVDVSTKLFSFQSIPNNPHLLPVLRERLLTRRDKRWVDVQIASEALKHYSCDVLSEPLPSSLSPDLLDHVQLKLQSILDGGKETNLMKEFFQKSKKGNWRKFNLARLAGYKTHRNDILPVGVELVLSKGQLISFREHWMTRLKFPTKFQKPGLKDAFLDQVLIPDALQYLNEARLVASENNTRQCGTNITAAQNTGYEDVNSLDLCWIFIVSANYQ
ncbi:hypothetical protein BCR33DRAFT_787407 [Rhizoclosmatium globosum]|uniref:Uncharacterized protein n=1 Tax=Rhizoclosmatium globosum TaxID=329046 RepID=A0A1Y2C1K3_9FUNG|nr:hypothetical protein BCR33DRAFT_787407 [Rhizoclosmatium globosum]|eukprot:ORY40757.1 hypothetical protein BCR33DRAFT_787407 [Rhizoclosmatium globosum]